MYTASTTKTRGLRGGQARGFGGGALCRFSLFEKPLQNLVSSNSPTVVKMLRASVLVLLAASTALAKFQLLNLLYILGTRRAHNLLRHS
jgi:hypothetical protein